MTFRRHVVIAFGIAIGLLLTESPSAAVAASPSPSPTACASPRPSPASSSGATPATGSGASPAPASVEDLCGKKAALDALRGRLGVSLTASLAAEDQLRQSLVSNDQQQRELQARIDAENANIAGLDQSIAATAAAVDATSGKIEAERSELALLARHLYMQPSSALMHIASAGSLRDALLALTDWTAAVSGSRKLEADLEADRAALETRRRTLSDDRDARVAAASALEADRRHLSDLVAEQQRSLTDLQAKIAQVRLELATLDKQSLLLAEQITKRLEAAAAQEIATAMAAVWAQVAVWLSANGSATAGGGSHSTLSRFIWPAPFATVSQGFGPTDFVLEPPFAGYAHFHTGVDLVEPAGSPIYACDDGTVAAVGSGNTGYGNYVAIAHAGGLVSLYGHLATAAVGVGDRVTQGQMIGLEGSTGNSTGPHLHFEVRLGGVPIDPAPYLPSGSPAGHAG